MLIRISGRDDRGKNMKKNVIEIFTDLLHVYHAGNSCEIEHNNERNIKKL